MSQEVMKTINDMYHLASTRKFKFLSDEYLGSMVKHKWQCSKGHEWDARPNDIKSHYGCPYCAGVAKRSLNEIKQEITNRGILLCSSVYKNMHSKYEWECKQCNHIWKATASSVIHQMTGCPKCAGKCYDINDIGQIAKTRGFTLLSKNFIGITKKYKWKCPDGHVWKATANHIKRGTGCPYCNNKYVQEEKCRFILEQLTHLKFIKDRIIIGDRLELDGHCKELNLAFEYHGKQHFKTIKYWHKNKDSLFKQQERDKKKLKRCKELGIDLIIIRWDCNIAPFLREELRKRNLSYNYEIKWDSFRDNPSRLQEVREAAHRIGIECLSKKYITAIEKMNFKCKKCGREWTSTSNDIKNGYGCLRCGGRMKNTIDEVRARGHKVGLDLLSQKYTNAHTKMEWHCQKCDHLFKRVPTDIQQGKGCPKCGIRNGWKTRRQHRQRTLDTSPRKSSKILKKFNI